MNYQIERIKKLEELLIPDLIEQWIIETDYSKQTQLYNKLWEYHLELKERRTKMLHSPILPRDYFQYKREHEHL